MKRFAETVLFLKKLAQFHRVLIYLLVMTISTTFSDKLINITDQRHHPQVAIFAANIGQELFAVTPSS